MRTRSDLSQMQGRWRAIKNFPDYLVSDMGEIFSLKTMQVLKPYVNHKGYFKVGLFDENGKNIVGTGHMVFDWFAWEKDGKDVPKIHPAQKPVKLLKKLIETFTDPYDVVIDPCFGSGATGRAAIETGRNFYGFEINKEFYRRAKEEMCVVPEYTQITMEGVV